MKLPESPRLFLVDGYALIYRAFYALMSRPLTTRKGENTSAAWGIANFLRLLMANHKPEYLGWVHDSGRSFRHQMYPAYKATREKLSEELQADFDRGMERISQILEYYRIPIITLPGFEADDVIGTLVTKSVTEKINTVIVTADKDFHQLVQPGIWLLNPGRGGSAAVEEHWVSVENATDRLGVPPERVTDYLALVGDSSDNVPGVRGIGDKTAAELVNEYGDLESILAHAAEIPKKRPREALLEFGENARLSKELVTIRTDLEVGLDLDSLKVRKPDDDRLRDLYVELEFYGLVKPGTVLTVVAPKKETEKQPTKYRTINTVADVEDVVKAAREAGRFSIDTETLIESDNSQKTDPLRSKLVSLSIGVAPGEAFYFPLGHVQRRDFQNDLLIDAPGDRSATDAAEDRGLIRGGDEPAPAFKPRRKTKAPVTTSIAANLLSDRSAQTSVTNLPPLTSDEMKSLKDLLEDPSVKKSGQNVKYDMLVLRKAGIQLRGIDFDTMLASYVLDPGRRSHGLDVLALEFVDRTMMSYVDLCGKGRTTIPFDECPIDAARDYSCEEADVILQLRSIFEPQLTNTQTRSLFDDIEMPLLNVLAEVEWTGITINLDWFKSLKERFRAEREAVEEQIYETAGTRFNINSNLQLREILFTKLELPVLKKTSTGPSTDASVLQELADNGHVLPSLLMEYRELAKLESTYLDALPELVNPTTGRLHTSFSQTVAATGRLSSSEPNLQNIPIRREMGRDIRRGFIPREGWRLVSADYSQIELRLLAHLSGDPAFVEAFRVGGDIHKQTAAIIFDVSLENVTAEMRSRAKTINFATIYGQGAHALSKQLKIEHADARVFIARYFERFSGIRHYLDSSVEFAREHGYAQTIFGRRRYIPELRERNFNIRAFGERVAANSPIQGSAADLIKIAMIRIDTRLREEGLKSKMLLQVHDELVFESPPDELSRLESLVKEEMESAARLSVPLVVDVGHGANWVETKS